MFRTFAIAATTLLTVSAAQADDSLTARVHDAAVKACAAKIGDNLPISYYRALSTHCADRVTADALARIRAKQVAQVEASTAQN
ncbi:MAG TPA: hypothetical protein VHZ32_11280 [Rhizomicrobium sp.]|jgi:hypothetical protein|nr:hypothetical protein [Rhizomicrobium sp.]